MGQRGIEAPVDDIMVTAGSTQAIEVICRVMLDPGDTIIVENPTFLGALEIFETYEVKIVGIDVDEHGMVIDDLRAKLAAAPKTKIIYTIPTFQNPTGTTMPRISLAMGPPSVAACRRGATRTGNGRRGF